MHSTCRWEDSMGHLALILSGDSMGGPASTGSATETETWLFLETTQPDVLLRRELKKSPMKSPMRSPMNWGFSWENHRSQWWMFHCYDLISGGYVDGTHRRSGLLEYHIVKRQKRNMSDLETTDSFDPLWATLPIPEIIGSEAWMHYVWESAVFLVGRSWPIAHTNHKWSIY